MSTEFRYHAWSRRAATEIRGSVRAASASDARRMVEDPDTLVLAVEAERRPALTRRQLRLRPARVRPVDVAWLARQLATTETAGLPIKRALETIASQKEGTAIGHVVADISRRLSEGQDLTAAFGAHEPQLGSVSVALVAAGAAGGVLAATFTKLAEALEAQVAIRRKIRGALTYPAVVLALSVAMAASMLLFVVPTFKGLYTELHGQLPWPTRVLVAASNIARSDFWLLPAVGAAAAAAGRRWYRQHRLVADAAKVRVPVIGAMLNKGAVTRVASTLASLLEAGVTTLVGLDMAAAAAGLEPLSMSLATVAEHVRNGRPLTAALAEDGLWPDVMVQLVRVGEETGQVPALLARYAEISRQELSAEVERVVSLIEPLMVVVIGGVVGVTVVCLYLPLFDLVNLIH